MNGLRLGDEGKLLKGFYGGFMRMGIIRCLLVFLRILVRLLLLLCCLCLRRSQEYLGSYETQPIIPLNPKFSPNFY